MSLTQREEIQLLVDQFNNLHSFTPTDYGYASIADATAKDEACLTVGFTNLILILPTKLYLLSRQLRELINNTKFHPGSNTALLNETEIEYRSAINEFGYYPASLLLQSYMDKYFVGRNIVKNEDIFYTEGMFVAVDSLNGKIIRSYGDEYLIQNVSETLEISFRYPVKAQFKPKI